MHSSSDFTSYPVNLLVKPGVCGVCGSAVVQTATPLPGWHNGHLYELRDANNDPNAREMTLVKVRCMRHKDADDGRYFGSDGEVRVGWPGELHAG